MFNIIPCKLIKWHFYSRWLNALTKSPSSFRLKREDGLLQEDGCTMHITGLATFFLALNIRAATEIWNTSVPISPVYRKWNYTHISSLCIALFSKTSENFRNDGIWSTDYQASENKAQSTLTQKWKSGKAWIPLLVIRLIHCGRQCLSLRGRRHSWPLNNPK